VFNIADSAIVVGVIVLMYDSFRPGTPAKDAPA
jgi:lipoprotein signal peptidase